MTPVYQFLFVTCKPFQPSLMIAGKAGAYPSEASFMICSPLAGRLLALLANISLGWQGLQGTNAPANYE